VVGWVGEAIVGRIVGEAGEVGEVGLEIWCTGVRRAVGTPGRRAINSGTIIAGAIAGRRSVVAIIAGAIAGRRSVVAIIAGGAIAVRRCGRSAQSGMSAGMPGGLMGWLHPRACWIADDLAAVFLFTAVAVATHSTITKTRNIITRKRSRISVNVDAVA
jgi:hypothetical protein